MDQILIDKDGNILESIENISETELITMPAYTHCLAVVKLNDDYLLGWNKWRSRYEIFGGCAENGETPRECIARECYEELGIKGDFRYIGAMRLTLQPDWFCKETRVEYGGLYGVTVKGLTLDELAKGIKDKEEIMKLALYSEVKGKEPIAEIDEVLLKYYE